MASLLSICLLALAVRDGTVLALCPRPFLLAALVWIAAVASTSGFLADAMVEQDFEFLRAGWPGWLLVGVHLVLFGLMKSLGGRMPVAAMWAGVVLSPLSWSGLCAVSWLLLQASAVSSGWAAGLIAACAWAAAAALGGVLAKAAHLRSETAREAVVVSQFGGFIFWPGGGTGMNVYSIHDLLYTLSTAFLWPTLLGTLAAFAYGVWVLANFLAEFRDRRANDRALNGVNQRLLTPARFQTMAVRRDWRRFQQALAGHDGEIQMLEKTVADLEHRMLARVERLGIMAKVGPMLGLIGTLIPLQPALAGLARGDMQAMGSNLQIGFTTTVLGLLVGGVCYAVSVVLKGWYQQDVMDMYFLLSLWTRGVDEPALEPVEFETANLRSRFEEK